MEDSNTFSKKKFAIIGGVIVVISAFSVVFSDSSLFQGFIGRGGSAVENKENRNEERKVEEIPRGRVVEKKAENVAPVEVAPAEATPVVEEVIPVESASEADVTPAEEVTTPAEVTPLEEPETEPEVVIVEEEPEVVIVEAAEKEEEKPVLINETFEIIDFMKPKKNAQGEFLIIPGDSNILEYETGSDLQAGRVTYNLPHFYSENLLGDYPMTASLVICNSTNCATVKEESVSIQNYFHNTDSPSVLTVFTKNDLANAVANLPAESGSSIYFAVRVFDDNGQSSFSNNKFALLVKDALKQAIFDTLEFKLNLVGLKNGATIKYNDTPGEGVMTFGYDFYKGAKVENFYNGTDSSFMFFIEMCNAGLCTNLAEYEEKQLTILGSGYQFFQEDIVQALAALGLSGNENVTVRAGVHEVGSSENFYASGTYSFKLKE